MRRNWYHSIVAIAFIALLAEGSWAQDTARAKPPKMKMTTEIPPGITTPDEITTRLGTLNFFDGVPDKEAVQKVYNFLDFQHAFQTYMSGVQIASMDSIRKGILEFGPANTTAVLCEELMDSKAFFLTANTTSVYMFSWLQLEKDEPMVPTMSTSAPRRPKAKENNWVQTIPSKGWNMIFRLYGPLEPWYDKTGRARVGRVMPS